MLGFKNGSRGGLMRDTVQWIALLGMLGIGVLFVIEARKWRRMGAVMGRRQRILRAFLFLFIEILFVMMLIGPIITSRKDPFTSLLYWTACLTLALVVILLALFDFRMVTAQYARLNQQIFRELKEDDRREK